MCISTSRFRKRCNRVHERCRVGWEECARVHEMCGLGRLCERLDAGWEWCTGLKGKMIESVHYIHGLGKLCRLQRIGQGGWLMVWGDEKEMRLWEDSLGCMSSQYGTKGFGEGTWAQRAKWGTFIIGTCNLPCQLSFDFLRKLAGKVANCNVMTEGHSHVHRSAGITRMPRIDYNPPFILCHPNLWNKWS